MDNFALPLFALIDRHKVDLGSPQLPQLAEQLQVYLASHLGLRVLDCRIEVLDQDRPLLVLNGVEAPELPRLFALADVQRTTVFRYHKLSAGQVELTPLAVKPA